MTGVCHYQMCSMATDLVFAIVVLYYWPMINAMIDEVFASVQGEGPWVGQRHIFVRFIGCDLRCAYCDTPDAVKRASGSEVGNCRAQVSPGSFERESVPNPLTPVRLSSLCARLRIPGRSRPVMSLTGGEPLLHAAFLQEWLPFERKTFRVYLETSGVHYAEMRALAGLVDVVSMDIKLPSATGHRAQWDEHRKFLSETEGVERFVKVVVTGSTMPDEILIAARLVSEQDQKVLFIIQPASGPLSPGAESLILFQDIALEILEDVRVIPQVHKILHLP
jgi:organic radical activating enzyme